MDKAIRILLIEDNPADAYLLEEMLKAADVRFEMECIDRLSSGIAKVKSDGFHIILLDLGLPDSRGLDTLTRLNEIIPEAPIIVLTGLADEALGIQAVQQGAQDFLVKGQVDKNLLVRSINYAIGRKKIEERERLAHKEVSERTSELYNANIALRVLLKQREEDKNELEEKILSNVKELIMPLVEELKKSGLSSKYRSYLGLLESNLLEIVSPFSVKLSSKYANLTNKEILVADFIKRGKSTKEIAGILDVSKGTIDSHRNNIRKKLGLNSSKTNLRTYLSSII
ncbi:MAG: response regulator [Dissulfurispiraceae bacterium]|jgi:DNA-binding NarL/FixJ family response regulator